MQHKRCNIRYDVVRFPGSMYSLEALAITCGIYPYRLIYLAVFQAMYLVRLCLAASDVDTQKLPDARGRLFLSRAKSIYLSNYKSPNFFNIANVKWSSIHLKYITILWYKLGYHDPRQPPDTIKQTQWLRLLLLNSNEILTQFYYQLAKQAPCEASRPTPLYLSVSRCVDWIWDQ